ncbi:MAG: aldose 1-epimerase family protein [Clostridia bacterium]|nr:aldose 1-epimerase family protein [Clostridia bacterium]
MKKQYVADPSALCGAERITFADGKADGVEAVRMYNGKLDITVVLDRAMDIFRLFYKGTPISYVSKNGLVSPKLCETAPYSFLNSFDAGFMYTCGLDNIGAPAEVGGRTLPQHGSFSYIPAENVHTETKEIDGEYYISLKGTMRFTALFGNNMTVEREIRMKYMGSEVTVTDTVINNAYVDSGYMLMYHSNVGYPLLSESSRLTVDGCDISPVSDVHHTERCFVFEEPTPARPEEVYRHTLKDGKGIKARLENPDLGLGMRLSFDTADFPYLVEWKSMACGDYVLGIEPVTIPVPERTLRTLRPGESATHSVSWEFYEI